MRRTFLVLLGIWLCLATQKVSCEDYIPGEPLRSEYEGFPSVFLATNCVDCHGDGSKEGGFSLEDLGPVDETNAALWTSVWSQVTLGEMPPKDVDQPDVVSRLKFADWVVASLSAAMEDQGGFRLPQDPDKGNFVDHDLLFGTLPEGIQLKPPSSPARLWRVTPQEHMTRLNALINKEPDYDPSKPGVRTEGDEVPTNHGGELKIYFGTDRIIQWQGGTVAYATAVKSAPAILSTARDHGLENYPELYTVNSAEAVQILGLAGDLIRYMAYGPLSIAEPYQITDDPKSIADKMRGDIRGLPTSIVYSTKVMRPLTPLVELFKRDDVPTEQVRESVEFLFESLCFRPPTHDESDTYVRLVEESIAKIGREKGIVLGLSAIFLDRDALFRTELVLAGEPDADGRVMLQDWELGLAVNHALRYLKPDETLREAILQGRMRTREDVRREVERMLGDPAIRKPRILRFFREYFDYDQGGYICKDSKALNETGLVGNDQAHYRAMFDATASTDRLVEIVLAEDKDVLKRLLTTHQVIATNRDRVYFGTQRTTEEVRASVKAEKLRQAEADRLEAEELQARIEANPGVAPPKPPKKKTQAVKHKVSEADLIGSREFARVSRRSFGNGSMEPGRILATVPDSERLGILTHPSWLVSHSDAMDNHAIRRGRWVRERLLGGGIPDVPITVDAMLPDAPKETLRERMRVTREDYCWTCHRKMDPLGLPFEMFNHAGLFRTKELDRPVDTSGEIIESGDPNLDGPVANAVEMIAKISESERAEQVFVRHAFRYWMGRNETVHDAPVLQAAHRAYKEGGGSMNALIVSLVTSDAFLYRTRVPSN